MRLLLRWVRRLVLGLAVLYMLALAALFFLQDRLIFPGWAGPATADVATVAGLSEIALPGPDGPLRAWWRPPDPGAPTIVVFHGNAGFQWRKLPPLADRGYGLLLTAYRGFAGNPGRASEAGLLEDARAMLAFVKAQEIAPADTLLYGESLGTGVAARMALEPGDWRALVLDAPYTSVRDRAAEMYPIFPVRALIRTTFDTLSIIDDVGAPLLIFHGTEDFIIPPTHGRALLEAAEEPKRGVWIEGGTHFLPPAPIVAGIEAFLADTGPQG